MLGVAALLLIAGALVVSGNRYNHYYGGLLGAGTCVYYAITNINPLSSSYFASGDRGDSLRGV